MTRFLYLSIFSLLFFLTVQGQDKGETTAFIDLIKPIIDTEKSGDHLIYRLDTMKYSRGEIYDYFNRDLDFGFKHRRIIVGSIFTDYHINLLCRNDTIFLSTITGANYGKINFYNYDQPVIDQFLKQRNKFYRSSKTVQQLIKETSLVEEYAFYCGDANPKTEKGKYIEQLVDEEATWAFVDMLKNFNCETQAYGVAGLEMLKKRDFQISDAAEKLIAHLKKRNTELVVCYGCLILIDKIYSKE